MSAACRAPASDSSRPVRAAQHRAVGLALLAPLLLAGATAAERRPAGTPGPEAEALARRMMVAVDEPAWQRTGAVRWSFRGDRDHLWDRHRGLARVRWGDIEVQLDLSTRSGVALDGGRKVTGDRAIRLVNKAFARWTNDAFWLNPVVKLLDQGTERSLVRLDGGTDALLVEYTSGGLTPGDAYLWVPGADDLPASWRMWTSNLPKGGVRATWESWVELATGARIATFHKLPLGNVTIGDLAGAGTLGELEPGPEPFAALLTGP